MIQLLSLLLFESLMVLDFLFMYLWFCCCNYFRCSLFVVAFAFVSAIIRGVWDLVELGLLLLVLIEIILFFVSLKINCYFRWISFGCKTKECKFLTLFVYLFFFELNSFILFFLFFNNLWIIRKSMWFLSWWIKWFCKLVNDFRWFDAASNISKFN